MAYVRFGVPKDADRTALEVEIHGSPGPLLDAARDRDADQATDAFQGIELHANSAVYTFAKVNDFSLGSHSYTATFSNGDKKLFVKVPKHGSSRFAAPQLPTNTTCDVIATSIAAKSKKDIATGIQIMEMGIGDLYDAMDQGRLPGDDAKREVVRWMYNTAKCLLDTGLVATDWKWENIAVMKDDPLTLRLIDVDSFYGLSADPAGQYTGTPDGLMPVLPLAFDGGNKENFKAQMVLTMAWTVVVNAVNVTLAGDTTSFCPNGLREWDEKTFFEHVERIAPYGSFEGGVWAQFAPYWSAYQRFDAMGWTTDTLKRWEEFVREMFSVAVPPKRATKRLKYGNQPLDQELERRQRLEQRQRAYTRQLYWLEQAERQGLSTELTKPAYQRILGYKNRVDAQIAPPFSAITAGFADLCV